MTEIEKITAWHNAAKANPVLQFLFPASPAEESGKYFLWAGHYCEYAPGRWTHAGWSQEEDEEMESALGGDSTELMAYNHWGYLGSLACFGRRGGEEGVVAEWRRRSAAILRDQATSYQWRCAHPERADDSIPCLEMEEWADGRIPGIDGIVAALLDDPITPVFPVSNQMLFDFEAPS